MLCHHHQGYRRAFSYDSDHSNTSNDVRGRHTAPNMSPVTLQTTVWEIRDSETDDVFIESPLPQTSFNSLSNTRHTEDGHVDRPNSYLQLVNGYVITGAQPCDSPTRHTSITDVTDSADSGSADYARIGRQSQSQPNDVSLTVTGENRQYVNLSQDGQNVVSNQYKDQPSPDASEDYLQPLSTRHGHTPESYLPLDMISSVAMNETHPGRESEHMKSPDSFTSELVGNTPRGYVSNVNVYDPTNSSLDVTQRDSDSHGEDVCGDYVIARGQPTGSDVEASPECDGTEKNNYVRVDNPLYYVPKCQSI